MTNILDKYQDIALVDTGSGYFDIDFDDQGDFLKTKGLDTSLLMTVFEKRRAAESEIVQPEQRNGWLGNDILSIPNFEIGSKNWLLYQSRADQETLNFAKSWNLEASQWYVEDDIVDSVEVNSYYNDLNQLMIDITFVQGNKTITKSINLWENTRYIKFGDIDNG